MPSITDFNAGNIAIRPSEAGVEAFAAAGRRTGAFYNQAAGDLRRTGAELGQSLREAGDAALDYATHQQINTGADKFSNLWATLQDSWNKTSANADVHDPATAKNWRENVLEPALQEFSSSGFFTTEKSSDWANSRVNMLRQHYFATTEGDMSRLAKDAVTETLENTSTNLSNTAFNDPSAVPAMLAHVEQTTNDIVGANPNIKGVDAEAVRMHVNEKLKRNIVQSGAYGVMMNSPDPEKAVQSFASRFPDYIDGSQMKGLARGAQIQAKQNLLLSKQIQLQAKQVDESNMHAALNEASDKYVTYGPQGVTVSPDYLKTVNDLPKRFPNAPNAWQLKQEIGNRIEALQKNPKGVQDDPATVQAFGDRLMSANNPLTQSDLLRAHDKLSNSTYDRLDKLIRQRDAMPTTPQFKFATEQAKAQIEGGSPVEKLHAAGKFAAFMQDFMTRYQRLSNAGTLQPNALDLNDPQSLISQTLSQYKSTLGQTIQNNGGVGAPAPKAPMASM